MNHAGNGNGHRDLRLLMVSDILTRQPKITRRQLHRVYQERAASKSADVRRAFYNEKTGKAFGLTTVHNDVLAVREVWKERTAANYDELVAESFAELDALSVALWREGNYDGVLKVNREKRRLLALDKPVDVNLKAQLEVKGVELSDEQRMERLAALLEAARDRASGEVGDGGGAGVAPDPVGSKE